LRAVLIAAVAFWPALVQAREDAPPVRPGDRIRIAAATLSETPVEARVVDADRTSLRIEVSSLKTPVVVPLSSIRHLDVSRAAAVPRWDEERSSARRAPPHS
jgi:hypothetical protein